jgi:hypothetical protein
MRKSKKSENFARETRETNEFFSRLFVFLAGYEGPQF